MSSFAARSSELLGAIAASCDRLVHPSVACPEVRIRHRRTIGLMLAAPFFFAMPAAMLLPSQLGSMVVLAAICAIFGCIWLVALLVSVGREHAVGSLALAGGTVLIGSVIAAAGGLASPLAVLAIALPIEAFWLRRTPRAAIWGAAAALAVLPLQAALHALLFSAAPVTAWHWLVPLAYAATVAFRMAAERQPAESTAHASAWTPLEQMIDAVVLRLERNGEIVDVSEKSRSVLGLPADVLLGTGLFDRIHVADRVAYLCALADMREGAQGRRIGIRLRSPHSTREPVADHYRLFELEMMRGMKEGEELTAILRATPGIESIRQELAAATDKAESAEVTKARFLAAVSHELRTPLNAIIGFSDMLLLEMFGSFNDPRQKEYVGLVRQSGHHLLEVVNSILAVSKIEAGAYAIHPEPFAFSEAAEMCQSMMNLQAGAKAIALTTDIAASAGEINADRRAIQQILINLVSNALKFTPDGGNVAIGAQQVGSRLHFWVSDTGIGIAPEDLGRIGQPFTQVQNDYTRSFEGTGLGLALVKGLVTLHEGTMSIESAPGEGTTVRISLPVEGPVRHKREDVKGQLLPMLAARRKEIVDGAIRKTA